MKIKFPTWVARVILVLSILLAGLALVGVAQPNPDSINADEKMVEGYITQSVHIKYHCDKKVGREIEKQAIGTFWIRGNVLHFQGKQYHIAYWARPDISNTFYFTIVEPRQYNLKRAQTVVFERTNRKHGWIKFTEHWGQGRSDVMVYYLNFK